GDLGQDVISVDERGVDAQGQAIVVPALADRQELDDVAQVPGELDVLLLEAVDPFDVDIRLGDAGVEGEAGEQRHLPGGVAAGDIQRGVGFGKPLVLGFFQRLLVGPAVAGHSGEDDVAGAVDDADEGVDAIGGQATDQGVDDGDAAAGAGFEGDGGVVLL